MADYVLGNIMSQRWPYAACRTVFYADESSLVKRIKQSSMLNVTQYKQDEETNQSHTACQQERRRSGHGQENGRESFEVTLY